MAPAPLHDRWRRDFPALSMRIPVLAVAACLRRGHQPWSVMAAELADQGNRSAGVNGPQLLAMVSP